MQATRSVDDATPVFPIAVAAELAGMHPQTLRQYDRLGLVVPARTAGRVRRYSLADVTRLREIAELSEDGLGLEGIVRVLRLREEVQHLRRRVRDLERELAEARERSGHTRRVFSAGENSVVAMVLGERPRRGEIVRWRPDVVTGYSMLIDLNGEVGRPGRSRSTDTRGGDAPAPVASNARSTNGNTRGTEAANEPHAPRDGGSVRD